MRLWHDDVRPAPDGWICARTNDEAIEVLLGREVTECSLDHDLGCVPSDGIYARGQAEETGLDLVRWMVEHNLVPDIVTIHSWSPSGARNMANVLADAGYPSAIAPYREPSF